MVDVSLNITAEGRGLAKIVASEGPMQPPDPSKLKPLPVYAAWFKADGQDAVAPITALLPGDTPNSFLFGTGGEISAKTLGAMVAGDSIQIAASFQKGTEQIYFGRVELTTPEKGQFAQCIKELF